jgi:hypothetical protein
MQKGFYHASRGYWQTMSEPSQDIIDAYPEGTISIPIRPLENYEWNGVEWVEVALVPTADDVDAERDRRIANGFSFGAKQYQSRASDLENIAGAATAALGAIVGGAVVGNFRWHGGATDFAWIAEDNTLTVMDAQTMFGFAQIAMAHKQAHMFAARALKDMPINPNYADDGNWP